MDKKINLEVKWKQAGEEMQHAAKVLADMPVWKMVLMPWTLKKAQKRFQEAAEKERRAWDTLIGP